MSNHYSVYVPSVTVNISEFDIVFIFQRLKFGEVIRVDFTPLHKKPGFICVDNGYYKSAFIHFRVSGSSCGKNFVNIIEEIGVYRISGRIERMNVHVEFDTRKAKNPIPETMMNIHQVVHNATYLEKKVLEQEQMIQQLSSEIHFIRATVNQLIGGLYNQTNQKQLDQMNVMVDILHGNIDVSVPVPVSHSSCHNQMNEEEEEEIPQGAYPTTRQGDVNHSRISLLESHMEKMVEEMACLTGRNISDEVSDDMFKYKPKPFSSRMVDFENEDNHSETTHSSMPSLISYDSIDSITSSDRIRNSYDLCGNN